MIKQRLATFVARLDMRSNIRNYLYLTVGGLLLAVNVNLFLFPNKIAPGGVSGIGIIVNHYTNLPIGLVMLSLNIPLLVLGFRYFGRGDFLVRTLYVIILYNLGIDVIRYWYPLGGIADDLLVNALYGGALGGIATGLVYRGYGTPGGTGILGRVLQLKTGTPLSQVYIITDGGIVMLVGFVFGWEMALYAFITLFVWGVAADNILEGPSLVRTVLIVTDQPDPVSQMVFRHLKLGITAWTAQGMFTGSKHTVLFCTINRLDVNVFKSIAIEADTRAFVVIGHGHQAYGGVFRGVNRNGV